MSKGQTSMIAIVIAIVMLIFIMLFLFTNALSAPGTQSLRGEYRKLYVTNLLLSLLNTDTECGTLSDMIKSMYFGGKVCSDDDLEWKIHSHISSALASTGNTDYRWLLETTPKNFMSSTMQWGESTVISEPGYWDSRTVLSSGSSQLEVKLYIRTN